MGYASSGPQGPECPTLISGGSNVSRIIVSCRMAGGNTSTPQHAASVTQATVNRFAPKASDWAKTTLAGLAAGRVPTTSMIGHTIAGSTAVQIIQSTAEVVLQIEPKELYAPPATTTTAHSTTSTSH